MSPCHCNKGCCGKFTCAKCYPNPYWMAKSHQCCHRKPWHVPCASKSIAPKPSARAKPTLEPARRSYVMTSGCGPTCCGKKERECADCARSAVKGPCCLPGPNGNGHSGPACAVGVTNCDIKGANDGATFVCQGPGCTGADTNAQSDRRNFVCGGVGCTDAGAYGPDDDSSNFVDGPCCGTNMKDQDDRCNFVCEALGCTNAGCCDPDGSSNFVVCEGLGFTNADDDGATSVCPGPGCTGGDIKGQNDGSHFICGGLGFTDPASYGQNPCTCCQRDKSDFASGTCPLALASMGGGCSGRNNRPKLICAGPGFSKTDTYDLDDCTCCQGGRSNFAGSPSAASNAGPCGKCDKSSIPNGKSGISKPGTSGKSDKSTFGHGKSDLPNGGTFGTSDKSTFANGKSGLSNAGVHDTSDKSTFGNGKSGLVSGGTSHQTDKSTFAHGVPGLSNGGTIDQTDKSTFANGKSGLSNGGTTDQTDKSTFVHGVPGLSNGGTSHQTDQPTFVNGKSGLSNGGTIDQTDKSTFVNGVPGLSNGGTSHQTDKSTFGNGRSGLSHAGVDGPSVKPSIVSEASGFTKPAGREQSSDKGIGLAVRGNQSVNGSQLEIVSGTSAATNTTVRRGSSGNRSRNVAGHERNAGQFQRRSSGADDGQYGPRYTPIGMGGLSTISGTSIASSAVSRIMDAMPDMGNVTYPQLLYQQLGEFAELRSNQEMELRILQQQPFTLKLREKIDHLLEKQRIEQPQMQAVHLSDQSAWRDRNGSLNEAPALDALHYTLVDSRGRALEHAPDGSIVDERGTPVSGPGGQSLFGPVMNAKGRPLVDNDNGIIDQFGNTVIGPDGKPIYGPRLDRDCRIVLGKYGEIIGVNGRSLVGRDGGMIHPDAGNLKTANRHTSL